MFQYNYAWIQNAQMSVRNNTLYKYYSALIYCMVYPACTQYFVVIKKGEIVVPMIDLGDQKIIE